MPHVPASIRYLNPGAMWPGKIATKWGSKRWVYLSDGTGQGGQGHGNKIAIFENWVDGISAQLDLWRSSPNYKNKRFANAIAIWSGGNHVASYIAHVKARIPGMTEDTIMNDRFWQGPMGLKFLQVQAAHEAGQTIPAPPEDWIAAQKRVFAHSDAISSAKQSAGAVSAGAVTAVGSVQAVQNAFVLSWWDITGITLGIAIVVGLVIWWIVKRNKTDVTVA